MPDTHTTEKNWNWKETIEAVGFAAKIHPEIIAEFILITSDVESAAYTRGMEDCLFKLKNGQLCTNCGKQKESELSDWCGKCLSEE